MSFKRHIDRFATISVAFQTIGVIVVAPKPIFNKGKKMMFRIFCLALFACCLTFAGCDEANNAVNDSAATVGDAVDATADAAGDAVEATADAVDATVDAVGDAVTGAEAAAGDAAEATEEEADKAAEEVKEAVSE
jgi:hypothetical protein